MRTLVAEKTKTNPLGSGRNPRAGQAADIRITIRLTANEHARYTAAATAAGKPLAEWLRGAAEAQLAKKARRS